MRVGNGLALFSALDAHDTHGAATRRRSVKLIFGSLDALLAELAHHKATGVRVCRAVQRESGVKTAGVPHFTSRIIVTAGLDESLWAEARFWVGRGRAETGPRGLRLPAMIESRGAELAGEIKRRIEAAGFPALDGLLAHDTASMDNFAL